jgi:hypothetical protein
MQIDLINCAEVEAASQITLFERGVRVPDTQYKESFRRIHDNLTRALRALTCCSRDDMGSPVHLMRPPTGTQLARRSLQHRTQRPAVLPGLTSLVPPRCMTLQLHGPRMTHSRRRLHRLILTVLQMHSRTRRGTCADGLGLGGED